MKVLKTMIFNLLIAGTCSIIFTIGGIMTSTDKCDVNKRVKKRQIMAVLYNRL